MTMLFLKKILVLLLVICISAFVGGTYGVIHDEISYTFSNEYFTKFKFIQFNIPWAYNIPRVGVAYVGFSATWWMGVFLYLILGFVGFKFKNPKIMLINLLKSIPLVIFVVFVTGIIGLVFGFYHVNQTTINTYSTWLSPDIEKPLQFVRVGFMHNASYFGGLTGLFAGITFLLKKKNSDH